MPKYSRQTQKTVRKAVRKYKRGTLESGRTNRNATSRKQAVAIGLSEARKKGYKTPPKRRR